MQNKRNYYRVLHLQPDAPQAMVKTAYRTIMQKLKAHPDLGGDEWNASLINEAYETLSNPAKRKAYDNNFFANREKSQASSQSQGQRKKAKTNSNNSANTKSKSKREQQKSSSRKSHNSEKDHKQQNHKQQEHRKQESKAEQHSGKTEPRDSSQEFPCLFCGAKYLRSAITDQDDCISCNSPLHLPSIETSNSSDRRTSLRMPSGTALTILTRHAFQAQGQANRSNGYASNIFSAAGSNGKAKGKVLDISLTGMRIQSQIKQSLGDIVQIESDTLIALAEVSNQINPRTYVYGLKFLTLKFKQNKGGFVSTAV